MIKKFVPLLFGFILLVGVACSTSAALFETGSISFTAPTAGTTTHEDLTAEAINVPISVQSTFNDYKYAMFLVDGSQVTYQGGESFVCPLTPNTITNCGSIPIVKPGLHTITAQVTKIDGSVVTAQTTYEWTPYSALDKTALWAANAVGSSNPVYGYIMLVVFLIVASVITTMVLGAKLTNGNVKGLQTGAGIGFFASMILLALGLYMSDSSGGAIIIANGLIGIIVLAIIVTFLRGIKYGHSSVTGPNGETASFTGLVADGSDHVPAGALGAGERLGVKIVDNAQKRLGYPSYPTEYLEDLNDRR